MQGRRYQHLYLSPRIAERREACSGDMLTQLCQAADEDGLPFRDQDIVDLVSLVMLAADEATTCGLTSVIWMLTCYPEWQEKLRQESLDIGTNTFDYTEMERLRLTSCFVRETFRRYPPVPVILRRSIGGCTILGREIPPNTQIVICPVLLHHHADYWTEPEHFDPERFLEARAEDSRHSHSFIPFGGGAHRCAGMHLALLQITAFLVQLLSRYRIRLKPKEQVKMTMVPFTRPKGGLPVILERL
jgi:cytochrome P450